MAGGVEKHGRARSGHPPSGIRLALKNPPLLLVLMAQLGNAGTGDAESICHCVGTFPINEGSDDPAVAPALKPEPLVKIDAKSDGVGNGIFAIGDDQRLPIAVCAFWRINAHDDYAVAAVGNR